MGIFKKNDATRASWRRSRFRQLAEIQVRKFERQTKPLAIRSCLDSTFRAESPDRPVKEQAAYAAAPRRLARDFGMGWTLPRVDIDPFRKHREDLIYLAELLGRRLVYRQGLQAARSAKFFRTLERKKLHGSNI